MNALDTEDDAAARESIAVLWPGYAGGGASKKGSSAAPNKGKPAGANAKDKPAADKKGGADKKGASKDKGGAKANATQPAPAPSPVSPHLNLALARWLQHSSQDKAADVRLTDWLTYQRAPARAYLVHAEIQSGSAEYDAAIATLQDGARRVGTARLFLPSMVAAARDAKNTAAAQEYVRRCGEEEQKNKSIAQKITGLFKADPLPTGLYAECLANLGTLPPPPQDKSSAAAPNAVGAINGLREGIEKKR